MRLRICFLTAVCILLSVFSAFAAEQIKIKGFTEASHDVTLGLPESGRIAVIKVQEGSFVEKGQVLLFLDKRIEELEVRRRSLMSKSMEELNFAIKKSSVLKTQYAAAKKLRADGNVISREEFEAKQIEYEQALADVEKIRMQKKLQKIELSLAAAKLNRKILKSPVRGYVAEISKEPGESTQAHEKLVRIVDSSKGIFVGSCDANLASAFKNGARVKVRLKTFTGEIEKEGEIIFVSPTIDTASGLIKVKAEFDNKGNRLKLGATAELIIN